MSRALEVGDGFKLPADQAEDVIAIIGRRGRGKTNTAVVLVEELHRAGARFCIADPVGVWWGLRSSKDGRAAGIPVVVMGGEHGDVPLEETAGKVIADFVADATSPSVVLDFRGFRKGQMTRFMTDFLEQLYHRNRDPLHLVLDEADQFAPQRVMGETARLVGAAEDVCKMGRAKGLLPIVITQRPAALNKNVLTQAGLLIAHQLTGPQDQKAVDEWIRANADDEQRAEFMGTIATLERGEAWFWQPEIPVFRRVHVRERRTFDSSATPKRGEKRGEPKAVAEVDLDALKVRIASTIEKAKAEDPRELKRTVADLRAQLAKAQAVKPAAATKPPRVVEKRVPAVDPKVTVLVERAVEQLDTWKVKVAAKLDQDLVDVREDLQALARIVARRVPAEIVATDGAGRAAVNSAAAQGRPAPVVSRAPIAARAAAPRANADAAGDGSLGNGVARRLLAALAQFEQLTHRRLAMLAGVKRGGSTWRAGMAKLRAGGWIIESGELAAITETGRATLGDYDELPTGRDLHDYWRNELGGGAARRAFDILLEAWPHAVAPETLAERMNVDHGGSTWRAALAKLRGLELIQRDQLKAADELHDAGGA